MKVSGERGGAGSQTEFPEFPGAKRDRFCLNYQVEKTRLRASLSLRLIYKLLSRGIFERCLSCFLPPPIAQVPMQSDYDTHTQSNKLLRSRRSTSRRFDTFIRLGASAFLPRPLFRLSQHFIFTPAQWVGFFFLAPASFLQAKKCLSPVQHISISHSKGFSRVDCDLDLRLPVSRSEEEGRQSKAQEDLKTGNIM